MATFKETQDKVRNRLNKGNVSPIDDKAGEIINFAIQFFSKNLYYFNKAYVDFDLVPEVEDISTNSQYPSNVLFLDSLSVQDGSARYPIYKLNDEEYADAYGFSDPSNGRPCYYTQQADSILVKPKPNIAYKIYIRYYKSYPNLVNDNDTNDFLQQAEEMIIERALEKFYSNYRIEPNLAAQAKQAWMELHEKLVVATTRQNATGQSRPRLSPRGFNHRNYRY